MIFVIINLMRCMAEMREFEREQDYPYSNSRLLPRISGKHFSYFFLLRLFHSVTVRFAREPLPRKVPDGCMGWNENVSAGI